MDIWKSRFVVVAAVGVAASYSAPVSASSNSCTPPVGRVDRLVCGSAKVRRLDAELGRLYDLIEGETRGIDGDTGKPVDPFGDEQDRWRRRVRDRCGTEACLARTYTARIADVRRHWADVL